jgi:hypothetical protein
MKEEKKPTKTLSPLEAQILAWDEEAQQKVSCGTTSDEPPSDDGLTQNQRLTRIEVGIAEARAIFSWNEGLAKFDGRAQEIADGLKDADAESLLRIASRSRATTEFIAKAWGAALEVMRVKLPEDSRQMLSQMYSAITGLQAELEKKTSGLRDGPKASAEARAAEALAYEKEIDPMLERIYADPEYQDCTYTKATETLLQMQNIPKGKDGHLGVPWKYDRLLQAVEKLAPKHRAAAKAKDIYAILADFKASKRASIKTLLKK